MRPVIRPSSRSRVPKPSRSRSTSWRCRNSTSRSTATGSSAKWNSISARRSAGAISASRTPSGRRTLTVSRTSAASGAMPPAMSVVDITVRAERATQRVVLARRRRIAAPVAPAREIDRLERAHAARCRNARRCTAKSWARSRRHRAARPRRPARRSLRARCRRPRARAARSCAPTSRGAATRCASRIAIVVAIVDRQRQRARDEVGKRDRRRSRAAPPLRGARTRSSIASALRARDLAVLAADAAATTAPTSRRAIWIHDTRRATPHVAHASARRRAAAAVRRGAPSSRARRPRHTRRRRCPGCARAARVGRRHDRRRDRRCRTTAPPSRVAANGRNTRSNSSPFALCSVMMRTRFASDSSRSCCASSRSSASAMRRASQSASPASPSTRARAFLHFLGDVQVIVCAARRRRA